MSKSETCKSWNDVVSFLVELPAADWACRGQSRDYHDIMKPRIDRCIDISGLRNRLWTERAICQRFREHAPSYLSPVEREYLATPWLQLVVMQHYGAPTRLLDWTKSPWVAVFFAVSDDWHTDGFVYGFQRKHLEKSTQENFHNEVEGLVWGLHPKDLYFDEEWDKADKNTQLFDPDTVEGLGKWVGTYYSRQGHFPRLVAQQGLFTFASRPDLDHWQYISTQLDDERCFIMKLKHHAKVEILRQLNTLGLNGATLFPGIDGIGRSLEGFARAWPDSNPAQF